MKNIMEINNLHNNKLFEVVKNYKIELQNVESKINKFILGSFDNLKQYVFVENNKDKNLNFVCFLNDLNKTIEIEKKYNDAKKGLLFLGFDKKIAFVKNFKTKNDCMVEIENLTNKNVELEIENETAQRKMEKILENYEKFFGVKIDGKRLRKKQDKDAMVDSLEALIENNKIKMLFLREQCDELKELVCKLENCEEEINCILNDYQVCENKYKTETQRRR